MEEEADTDESGHTGGGGLGEDDGVLGGGATGVTGSLGERERE